MSGTRRPVRVWDAPTRLFHWGVVVLLATSWLSQRQGWMGLHFLSGYATLAALLFRLAWGFVGSDTARFGRFLRSPLAGLRHLAHLHRREPDTEVGHNAAGGWMVLVLLLVLAAQAVTGLFSNDDISVEGPLAAAVGKDRSDWFSHWHHVVFTAVEVAVALHVLAVLAYALLKGHDLVRPMVTGTKRLPDTVPAPRLASPGRAAVIALAAAGLVAAGVRAFGS